MLSALKSRNAHLEVPNMFRFLLGIASGLQALFEHGVAHRDLKPGNVMLSSTGAPRLIDFGSASAKIIEIKSPKETRRWEDFISENCSMAYRAPEMFNLREGARITEVADLWVREAISSDTIVVVGLSVVCNVFLWVSFRPSPCEWGQRGSSCNLWKNQISSLLAAWVSLGNQRYLHLISSVKILYFAFRFRYPDCIREFICKILQVDVEKRPNISDVIKFARTQLGYWNEQLSSKIDPTRITQSPRAKLWFDLRYLNCAVFFHII